MKFLFSFFTLMFSFIPANANSKKAIRSNFSNTIADSSLPYALLAGGSKGIGYAIAEALAKRNYNLILVARNEDSLIAAKNQLEKAYPVHVKILVKDLAHENSAQEIASWCINKNIRLKMLCNVAGLGGEHDFLSYPLDSLRYMIRINLESVIDRKSTRLNSSH